MIIKLDLILSTIKSHSHSRSEVCKIQIIYKLGEVLSKELGISPAASRGLIKLAIKEELGPFRRLDTIGLRDYQKLIQNSLKKRIQKLNISNYEQLVDLLSKEILENQSLITMEKI